VIDQNQGQQPPNNIRAGPIVMGRVFDQPFWRNRSIWSAITCAVPRSNGPVSVVSPQN